MSYKIKIQCLAIIYHFFSPDYSSFVDNHSVIHIITVILSFTFIAAHTEHKLRRFQTHTSRITEFLPFFHANCGIESPPICWLKLRRSQ